MSKGVNRDGEVKVGLEEIRELKDSAGVAPLKRARICLHRSHDEAIQEMVIAICDDCYIGPHRQMGKSKSYVVLEGELNVLFFDDRGELTRKVEMTALGGGGCCSFRFDSSEWHTVLSLTSRVIYLETVSGPYSAEETDWAPWAPGADDRAGIQAFRKNLISQV